MGAKKPFKFDKSINSIVDVVDVVKPLNIFVIAVKYPNGGLFSTSSYVSENMLVTSELG